MSRRIADPCCANSSPICSPAPNRSGAELAELDDTLEREAHRGARHAAGV